MGSAVLKYNPTAVGDRLRFEVHSNPSRSGSSSGQEKWYMRGNQANEVSRWAQAIQKNIEFYRGDLLTSDRGHSSEHDGRSLRSIATTFRSSMSSASPFRRSTPIVQKASPASSIMEPKDEMWDSVDSSRMSIGRSAFLPGTTPVDETDADEDDFSMDSRSQYGKPPHDTSFSLQGNAAVAQAELTTQLISSLKQSPTSPRELADLKAAVTESADRAQQMFGEYVRMAQAREEWWKERLDREVRRGVAWEESLQVVVKEGEVLENELKSQFRQRSSRIEGTVTDGGGGATTPRRRISLAPGNSMFTTVSSLAASRQDSMPSGLPLSPPPDSGSPFESRPLQSPPPTSTEFGDTTDEEDEFFDAIESNSLPNVIVPSAFVAPPEVKPSIEKTLQMEQFAGYYKLRTRLPIEKDTRPPTSLWSVLKHSIGKDLTKISFPVFFNEPTSMLQRMVSVFCGVGRIVHDNVAPP